jgi:hypothetical protein
VRLFSASFILIIVRVLADVQIDRAAPTGLRLFYFWLAVLIQKKINFLPMAAAGYFGPAQVAAVLWRR